MYQVLDKYTIEMKIIPQMSIVRKGLEISVPIVELINFILYKLKTGVQWELLPVDNLFSNKV